MVHPLYLPGPYLIHQIFLFSFLHFMVSAVSNPVPMQEILHVASFSLTFCPWQMTFIMTFLQYSMFYGERGKWIKSFLPARLYLKISFSPPHRLYPISYWPESCSWPLLSAKALRYCAHCYSVSILEKSKGDRNWIEGQITKPSVAATSGFLEPHIHFLHMP